MITASDIDARRKAVPFEPFRIVMSSGLIYDVYHPDMVFITKRTIYVGIYEPGRAGFPERTAILSVLHISELQTLSVTTAS